MQFEILAEKFDIDEYAVFDDDSLIIYNHLKNVSEETVMELSTLIMNISQVEILKVDFFTLSFKEWVVFIKRYESYCIAVFTKKDSVPEKLFLEIVKSYNYLIPELV